MITVFSLIFLDATKGAFGKTLLTLFVLSYLYCLLDVKRQNVMTQIALIASS